MANKQQCHGLISETCGPSGTNRRTQIRKLRMKTHFKHSDSQIVLMQLQQSLTASLYGPQF